jgi:CheY-like chemotaxis protein
MNGRRVVILIDDPMFIALLGHLLGERGWETTGFLEAHRAFEAIQRDQPDLVILDVGVEHPDAGWWALSLLMLDPTTKEIPVVISSLDHSALHAREAWLQERGFGILPRPFELDDLFSCLEETIARKAACPANS